MKPGERHVTLLGRPVYVRLPQVPLQRYNFTTRPSEIIIQNFTNTPQCSWIYFLGRPFLASVSRCLSAVQTTTGNERAENTARRI